VKTFGLLTYIQRDIMNLFRSSPLRTNEYLVLLDDFISQRPIHQTNAFSESLKGKNFIMIMAESFDTYAIHEVLTPNLYQLKMESSFNNYYSPLYYRSTADTEFMSQLSLFPNKNVTLSMEAYQDNTFTNTLPRLFEQQGYKTFSYHNYTDYFYPRTYFHTNTLGFQVFKGASALGLLDEVPKGTLIFNHIWQRDSDLISLTVDEFINEDQFFVNYITVSGHFNYNSDHEVVPILSGTAHYHMDPWMCWRTAFRESLKLKAATDVESEYRLKQWVKDCGPRHDYKFAKWSHIGAQDAVEYWESVGGDFTELKKSYDWAWLASYALIKHNLTPDR
jgi:hypothetical protein